MLVSTEVRTEVDCNTICPLLNSITTSNLVTDTNESKELDIPMDPNFDDSSNKGLRKRGWFITQCNWTSDDVLQLESHDCRYIVWQFEICPTTATPHFHAFIYYDNPRIWPKRFWPRSKIQVAKCIKACIKYCKKELSRVPNTSWKERGTEPEQGKRSDLQELADNILKGATLEDIAKDNPVAFIRYHNGLKALSAITADHRTKPPMSFWIYGKRRIGKTKLPHILHGKDNIFMKDGTHWWDGYKYQECIVIDDFDGKWPFRDLIKLLDRYEYQVQYKGGYMKVTSPYIYITCEFHPGRFYGESENMLGQVVDRMAWVTEMTPDNVIDIECTIDSLIKGEKIKVVNTDYFPPVGNYLTLNVNPIPRKAETLSILDMMNGKTF